MKAQVTITGVSPILMHNFAASGVEGLKNMTPEEQAEYSTYRKEDTRELCVPSANLQRCLVSAASFSKGKGRATLSKTVAACVFVDPVYLGLGTTEFEVDKRSVVVPATRGRIMRYRPRINEWSVAFELEWDDTLISANQMRRIVDDAGALVGLLDFRPERKGPFGRFVVSQWN